jgi:hypothetical protein
VLVLCLVCALHVCLWVCFVCLMYLVYLIMDVNSFTFGNCCQEEKRISFIDVAKRRWIQLLLFVRENFQNFIYTTTLAPTIYFFFNQKDEDLVYKFHISNHLMKYVWLKLFLVSILDRIIVKKFQNKINILRKWLITH